MGDTATLTARRSNLLDLKAGLYLDNKWWMKLSLTHPPESRRLLVAGSVCWIISGLDLGEPLHAGGMDFGYTVFERSALNLIFDLAIPQSAFKGDELPLLSVLANFERFLQA